MLKIMFGFDLLWVTILIDYYASWLPLCHLTHWGRDKMAAFSQTTLSNAFSWMKMYKFRLRFHWSLLLRVQLTIFQHWFWYWLGANQATTHYLNQLWLNYQRIYASLGLNELIKFKGYGQNWSVHKQKKHNKVLTLWKIIRILCILWCTK